MFEYQRIYGIVKDNYISEFEPKSGRCLLIPECLPDFIKEVNGIQVEPIKEGKLNLPTSYVNGYLIAEEYSRLSEFINRSGKRIPIPQDIIKLDFFSCDRALGVKNKGEVEEQVYIDGLTGEEVATPANLDIKRKHPFRDGLARVQLNDGYTYLSKDMVDVAPKHYTVASDFFAERATVLDSEDDAWLLIDTSFATIDRIPNTSSAKVFFNKLCSLYTESHQNFPDDDIERIPSYFDNYSFIDKNTGFSVFMPEIIKKLAEYFELTLPEGTVKEQLVWLISEISKKGTYYLDLQNRTIEPVTIRKGIKISDGNNCTISYDPEDVEFLLERTKRGEE